MFILMSIGVHDGGASDLRNIRDTAWRLDSGQFRNPNKKETGLTAGQWLGMSRCSLRPKSSQHAKGQAMIGYVTL